MHAFRRAAVTLLENYLHLLTNVHNSTKDTCALVFLTTHVQKLGILLITLIKIC